MKKGKASKRRKQQNKTNFVNIHIWFLSREMYIQKAMNNSKNREKNQISINEEKKQKKNEEWTQK